ncbi:MAG: putative acetyltransferase [Syntrophorhabdus sp. PtaU1.Bin002]|nr:MAG: putative acetyltransferase [Syntrophorhabdus sp. PtaU1.Bin002]
MFRRKILSHALRRLFVQLSLPTLRNNYYRFRHRWGYYGKGVRIGKGVDFYGDLKRVFLYDNSEIMDYSKVFIVGPNASITLRENSSIGYFNIVNVHAQFVLGENSMTGPFVSFNDSDHAITKKESIRFSGYSEGVIQVDKDVWIGTGARVLKNVAIGEGAVIGANAVVTKNIPPWSVAVGIPAKVIRMRTDS